MVMWVLCAFAVACVMVVLASREAERKAKLAAAMERIEAQARTRPGGAPDRPIDVLSSSVVEGSAQSMQCPLCGAGLRVNEHAAETIGGERLRVAYVTCIGCQASRALYFRIKVLS
jgi:hypothetical protein